MPNTPNNYHIEENLNKYISLKDPEYAILLSGKWGSGKTFFINKFISNYFYKDNRFVSNGSHKDIKFVKISLFGLKNLDSIDERIFQELHPILGSKYAKLAGNMFKSALKLGINIDVDGDEKKDGIASVNLNSLNIFSKEEEKGSSKELIFIFDDLERTDIGLSEILGYINYFVEQSNFKVILLANEEKINEYDNDDKFQEFKEKVIGKTFEIEQNFDEVLNHFLNLAINSKTILKINRQSIKDIYLKAGYFNLRHIRQSILDFDYFYEVINKKYKEKVEFIEKLIYVFFILSIEIKKGQLLKKEFKNHNKIHWNFGLKEKEKEKEKTKFENILIKYDLLAYDALLLSVDNWIEILFKSKIVNADVNLAISETSYFRNKERESWIDLWYFTDLEDDKFKSVLSDVVQKFYDNEYEEHEKLLHVIALLLNFSKVKIFNKTSQEVIKQAKMNINNNKETQFWQREKYTPNGRFNKYSLGYYDNESIEFIEIQSYLIKESNKAFKTGLKNKADVLLEDFRNNDVNVIETKLHKEFRDKPIFTNISPTDFIDVLSKLQHSNMYSVINILKDRYEPYKQVHSVLFEEVEFWKFIDNNLLAKINRNEKPVKYYLLDNFKKYSLKEIIDNLNTTNCLENNKV